MEVTDDIDQTFGFPLDTQQASTAIEHAIGSLCTFASEVLAVIQHSIPQAIQWQWRQRVQRTIVYQAINTVYNGINKVAALYLHQHTTGHVKGVAVLFLHGDHGYSFTSLHLTDVAQEVGTKHIYSLGLSYNDSQSECHQTQLSQTIDKIAEAVTNADGCFKGVIIVGHSRGAVEAAHIAYVEQDSRIKAIIAIAGRFKVTPPPDRAPRESLAPTIQAIEDAITAHPPDNLYQIAADNDWCIPEQASLTVKDPTKTLLVEHTSHLNVIFSTACVQQVRQWLQQLLHI